MSGEHVYVAARFCDWEAAESVHLQLQQAGHFPVSTWVETAAELDGICEAIPSGDRRRSFEAQSDYTDLLDAHVFLLLVPAERGTGCWVELGMAYALNRRCMLVGPRDMVLGRTIFTELKRIEIFETVEDAIGALA